MSDEEKKNGEYEKPESHGAGADELEDVSGGAGTGAPSNCSDGGDANMQCTSGPSPTGLCVTGASAMYHGKCTKGMQG